jgi:hypothetical protein
LVCFLDRTNISLDFLRRSCRSKKRWNKDGELATINPDDAGVSKWCQNRWLDEHGDWFELTLLEDISNLEGMLFFQKECVAGDWVYDGKAAKRFSDCLSSIVIRMEEFVQEIGQLMMDQTQVEEYSSAAIFIALQAMEDDCQLSLRPVSHPKRVWLGWKVISLSSSQRVECQITAIGYL